MYQHSRVKALFWAMALGVMAAFSAPAFAVNDAMLDLLKALYENGQITAEQYELISNAAKADAEAVEGIKAEAKQEVAEATKDIPKVNIETDGKLVISDPDGDWEWQPIGRIFWDQIYVDDDGINDGDDVVGGGSELRRARLGFEAKFAKYFEGKLEIDFAGSEVDWKDVWISYNNKNSLGKWWLKFGQQHVPFGFATIASSKYMTFVDRPYFADGPTPARMVGVAFKQESEAKNRWFVHGGVFHTGLPGAGDTDNVNDSRADTDEIVNAAIRVGGTPFYQDDKHMLHVAGSYQYTDANGSAISYIDNILVSHIDDGGTLEADFGTNAEDVNSWDVDVVGIWGPFHVFGEYVHWSVDDPDGDADLSAWSVDAGWFLTGESMKYKYGQLSGISPNKPLNKGGWGAWQIAGRIQNMDLNDGPDIDGGEADSFSVALNWYPVKNVRVIADYTRVLDFECNNVGSSLTDDCETGADGHEPSAIKLRGLVYW